MRRMFTVGESHASASWDNDNLSNNEIQSSIVVMVRSKWKERVQHKGYITWAALVLYSSSQATISIFGWGQGMAELIDIQGFVTRRRKLTTTRRLHHGTRQDKDHEEGISCHHREIVSSNWLNNDLRSDWPWDFLLYSYPRLTLDFHTNKRIIDEVVRISG